jgi:hypothetical protein
MLALKVESKFSPHNWFKSTGALLAEVNQKNPIRTRESRDLVKWAKAHGKCEERTARKNSPV